MKYGEIVKAVNDVLAQYTMPLTLRQIYYRLVAKLLIPNTVTAYKTLSKLMVKARERGKIDSTRIEDRSRQSLGPLVPLLLLPLARRTLYIQGDWGYDNPDVFLNERIEVLRECWKFYTKSLWETQPKEVLILLEKDALSRLFLDVATKFRVWVYPTRGYASYTYVQNIADRMSEVKENIVLYFGDYDPSGRDIERDLNERLGAYGGQNFKIIRVALTQEQIFMHNLPPRPEDAATIEKLKNDPRTARYGMEYACELDALEPSTLQDLIHRSINALIDADAWTETLEQIQNEQQQLADKLSKLKIEWESGKT